MLETPTLNQSRTLQNTTPDSTTTRTLEAQTTTKELILKTTEKTSSSDGLDKIPCIRNDFEEPFNDVEAVMDGWESSQKNLYEKRTKFQDGWPGPYQPMAAASRPILYMYLLSKAPCVLRLETP